MHRITSASALPAAVAAALLLTAPAALGDDALGPQIVQAQQADVSDQQLQSFAAAAIEVQEINNEWQQRVNETQDPQQAQQMRRQASQEMAEAIRDEGLTIEEYNTIGRLARQDAQLQNKLREHMREAR